MTAQNMPHRPYLAEVFDPVSIAVVGASENTAKWGYQLARGALTGIGRRPVYFVNPTRTEILGQRAYASLADLPEPPEFVALAVPLDQIEEAIDESLRAGAKALLAVNAGLAETGADGRARQVAIVAKIRQHGAVLVGPNCLGVVDTRAEFELAWTQAGERGFPSGPATVISSSGNVGLEIAINLRGRGVGLARFASVGNQADLTIADYVRSATEHDATEVIAVYIEEFQEPRRLLAEMAKAVESGKHVTLISPRGEAAARVALSHTGALTSSAAIVESACRDVGVVVARTLADLIDLTEAGVRGASLSGLRAGVVSDGGGHAVLACDALTDAGFETPTFGMDLQAELRRTLAPSSLVVNPIDLAAANTRVDAFELAACALLDSHEVDLLVITGGMGSFGESIAGMEEAETVSALRLMAAARAAETPVLVHSMFPSSVVITAMQTQGALVHSDLAVGARALVRHLEAGAFPRAEVAVPPARPHTVDAPEGYFPARDALRRAGVTFPPATEVTSVEEAVKATQEIEYPVVLKAVDLLHKSDANGVKIGIRTTEELRSTFEAMQAETGSLRYSVEAMADLSLSVELIVGARHDPAFGPFVVVGSGGVQAELERDVELVLWPASRDRVRQALEALAVAPLLHGYRGSPACDIEAVIDVVEAVGSVLASSSAISDVEINPLLARHSGAIALDARVVST